MEIRDRIVELRRVPARDLIPNPKNWRRHPKSQATAMRAMLREIGYADATLARVNENGRLVLIDGHLRRDSIDPDQLLPVLVLDVTEAESDKLLLTLDPLAAMAVTGSEELASLLKSVSFENASELADLLGGLRSQVLS
jgi:hypothetical protein